MTDATAHTKCIDEALATKMDRNEPAGQLFSGSHTSIAFDYTITDAVHKINKICIADVNINPKQNTVFLTAMTWILILLGPDMI